jgi:sugar lactone lactonase YvrE
MPMRPCVWILAAALALAGCNLQKPSSTSKPRATAAPTAAKATAPAAATLAGKVALLLDAKAQGEPLISNNGGAIIANNGAGVVSNNSGSLISEHGGALTGKTKRGLLAASLTEFGLVDAVIALEDAAGKPVLDAKGQPLVTKTDAHGGYAFAEPLPDQALVLRVKLWQGGELVAVLPKGARGTQAIDTATTLGARYVLDQYVKGDQKTLERLPAAEAATLYADAAKAAALIDAAPSYKPADTVALAEGLRAKAPALDQTLTAIKALLLGQVGLGNGQLATSVPLNNPAGLMLDADGTLLFTEDTFGRIRRVAADGTLQTFADVIQGKVKRNFPFTKGAVRAPDGAIYIANGASVTCLRPDGQVITLLGQVAGTAAAEAYTPYSLAVVGDTLYVGETGEETHKRPPRLLKLPRAGGTPTVLPGDPGWTNLHEICGLAATPAGDVYLLARDTTHQSPDRLYHLAPGGDLKVMADDLKLSGQGNELLLAPDGTLYVSQIYADQVTAFKPDGSRVAVLGSGAPGAAANFRLPGSILLAPDGSLYVVRVDEQTIHRLAPDGKLAPVAGRSTVSVTDPATLQLDVPRTAVFDEHDDLLVTEAGQYRVLRFDGKAITTVVGGQGGDGGDGGPATAAQVQEPWGLALHGAERYLSDNGSVRIRKVDAAGTINALVGGKETSPGLKPGELAPAGAFRTRARTMAVSPAGQLYWANSNTSQIYRLRSDGQVEAVAGKFGGGTNSESALSQVLKVGPQQEQPQPALEADLGVPGALAFDAKGDLYVAEPGSLLIRKITGLDTPTPTISRVAGMSSLDALTTDGPGGGTATTTALPLPMGLALGPDGTIYVSELGVSAMPYLITVSDETLATFTNAFAHTNARVRKIAPDGKVTIIAGPGGKFFPDPLAPDGLLFPGSLALSKDGRLAIVDAAANLVHILPAGSF